MDTLFVVNVCLCPPDRGDHTEMRRGIEPEVAPRAVDCLGATTFGEGADDAPPAPDELKIDLFKENHRSSERTLHPASHSVVGAANLAADGARRGLSNRTGD
jgi:hypothetical protein